MKRLTTTILACSAVAFTVQHAGAAAQLKLSDGTAAGTVIVTDDGAGDALNTTPGAIAYIGPVGPNWFANVTTGTTYPNQGTPGNPQMDIGTDSQSADAGTLTIDFTQTGFTAGGSLVAAIGGTTPGTVAYQVYTDSANTPFAKTTLVADTGTLTPSGGGSFSATTTGTIASAVPYSITMSTTIQHPTGGGETGFDANLTVTPPACDCSLIFTSPTTVTVNAGDAIPDVTAVQDCGNGPVPVLVTFVGATTNGTCPSIVTRTYTATDNCGDVYTNVQTITINCPPPPCSCRITFTSPSYLTNCAGDTIPNVVATETCDSGLNTTVPTMFIGAKTNGQCPTIVVRTNAAMDNCGNFYTNVQTIVINCRASVCGHIFADCDGSGDLTAGDVGLSNVVVVLINSAGKAVATNKTDVNGGYCFTNLAGGSYTVSVTPPTGYSQTAASTSYHWKDNYGRICWQENDGYIHCVSSGTECWWDKSNCCHWKDSYGRDCWKDNWGYSHCQPCSYQSCNSTTYNDKICVTVSNCVSKTDVDFAYTGTKSCIQVTCSAPTYVKCGQNYTYTCTVQNTGNVCFKGGTVCHTIGNCNNWGGWSNCNNIYDNCPPLSPGQKCTFTHTCKGSSYGNIGCQANVTCYSPKSGNCTGQNSCYTQCGW